MAVPGGELDANRGSGREGSKSLQVHLELPGQVVGETMTPSLSQIIFFRVVSVSAGPGLSWPVRIWRAMSSVAFAMTCWPAKEMQVSRMAKTRAAKGIDSSANSTAVLPLRLPGSCERSPAGGPSRSVRILGSCRVPADPDAVSAETL